MITSFVEFGRDAVMIAVIVGGFACKATTERSQLPAQSAERVVFDDAAGLMSLYAIGSDSSSLLFSASGMAGMDSNLFVLDRAAYKLNKYDFDGSQVASTGIKGSGPGEFRNPMAIAVTDSFVVVSEQNTPVVHVFTHALEYQRDVEIGLLPIDMAGSGVGRVVASGMGPSLDAEAVVHSIDLSSTRRSTFAVSVSGFPDEVKDAPPGARAYWSIGTVDASGDFVCVGLAHLNRIVCREQDSVVWEGIFGGLPMASDVKVIAGTPVPRGPLVRDIAVDPEQRLYVLIGSNDDKAERRIRVYDRAGDRLEDLVLPFAAKRIVTQPGERLLAMSVDGSYIEAFRLTDVH